MFAKYNCVRFSIYLFKDALLRIELSYRAEYLNANIGSGLRPL
jgi:hypothetical protein